MSESGGARSVGWLLCKLLLTPAGYWQHRVVRCGHSSWVEGVPAALVPLFMASCCPMLLSP